MKLSGEVAKTSDSYPGGVPPARELQGDFFITFLGNFFFPSANFDTTDLRTLLWQSHLSWLQKETMLSSSVNKFTVLIVASLN